MSPVGADSPAQAASGAWSPFAHRIFAVMWTAVLIGNIGTWMRDVGAGWLMTSLSPSATMVALVQVAGTLPLFLLALPAGALADLVNRRRLLIGVNLGLFVVALTLGVAAQSGALTPPLLVALIALGGIGAALLTPVMQSLTPLQVPRRDLRAAIALNSMGMNVARAIGPALGGAIIAASSVAVVFYLDALSYLFVIAALLWWKGAATPATNDPPEAFGPALRTGVRFALNAPDLQRVLLRAAAFFIFASAYWALLPLIARRELGGDAGYYGIVLASIGAGAVGGAVLLPRWRSRFSAEATLRWGTALTVAVLVALALLRSREAALPVLALAGVAWIAVLTTANTAAQTALPNWVRGRGLAIYLTVFSGAMTAGSLLWGELADAFGVRPALGIAAALGAVSLLAAWLAPIADAERDLTPSLHWPEPAFALAEPGDAPVMVHIEYRVDAADRQAFLAALHVLSAERRRDGASHWQVWEDAAQPGRFCETFVEPSWQEHLRHHRRVTVADADLQQQVAVFHRGDAPPAVTHWVMARRRDPAA